MNLTTYQGQGVYGHYRPGKSDELDDCEKMQMLLAEAGMTEFRVEWRPNEEGEVGVHVFYPHIEDRDTIRRAFDLLYPGRDIQWMTGRDRGES